MMVHLYDILDSEELAEAIELKHVREQTHPDEPLAILNYTEACVYDNGWNDTTLKCRGLIYNTTNGGVVARPFPKFFNYGQPGAAEIALDAEVEVVDKVDGSLGILYRRPTDGYLAIATRGSFTSDQAMHATQLFRERYDGFTPLPEDTVLFEIVYPENRIVLDYGSKDDLILLGSVEIATGYVNNPRVTCNFHGWPGPLAQHYFYPTFADVLAAEPRPNSEGFVVRQRGTDKMVKLKQEDYVALHKIVTGLSARTVWQHIVDGRPMADLITPLPDEFHTWVLEVAHELNREVDRRDRDLRLRFFDILSDLPYDRFAMDDKRAAKKEFAMVAKDHPDAWALFALYDDKDIKPKLWEQVRPEAFITPSGRTYTEDAA